MDCAWTSVTAAGYFLRRGRMAGLEPTDTAMVDRPTLLLLGTGGATGDASTHSGPVPLRRAGTFDRFVGRPEPGHRYLDHPGIQRADSDQRRDPSGWDLDTWADDVVRFCDDGAGSSTRRRRRVLRRVRGHAVRGPRHPGHPSRLVLASTLARGAMRYGPEVPSRSGAGPTAAASVRGASTWLPTWHAGGLGRDMTGRTGRSTTTGRPRCGRGASRTHLRVAADDPLVDAWIGLATVAPIPDNATGGRDVVIDSNDGFAPGRRASSTWAPPC